MVLFFCFLNLSFKSQQWRWECLKETGTCWASCCWDLKGMIKLRANTCAANVLHIKLPRHRQNQKKKNCESMHPGGGDDSVWMEKVTGGVRRDRSSMENTFEQSFYHVWSVCMCVRPSCHYRWGSFKLHIIRSTMAPIIRQPINLLSCRGLDGI